MQLTLFKQLSQGKSARRIAVLSVLSGITLTVGTVSVVSYRIVQGLILTNLKQQALQQVRQGSDQIDLWLANRKAEIETLANTPTVRSMDWAEVDPYLQSELKRLQEFRSLRLADRNGVFLDPDLARSTVSIKDREWFINAIAGRVNVANPIVSRLTGVVQIIIGAPVSSAVSSPPSGAICGTIRIDRLIKVVDSLRRGAGSYAFALNSQGVAIAHPDPSLIGTPEKPVSSFLKSANPNLAAIAQRMVDHQAGIDLTQIDNKWQYVAYVPLKQADWSIALVIPRENIESNLGALNLLASVLSLLLVIALIGIWRQVQLFEQTRTRAAQEALFNRLTTRIRESLDLQTIVKTTVTELASLDSFERVLFGWYDAHTSQFEQMYEFPNMQLESVHQFQLLQVDKSVDLVTCLAQSDAIRLSSVAQGQSLELQAQHYMALPILTKVERLGYLIGVYHHTLSLEDRELLQSVADQLAIAITQSRLYAQTQAQVQRLNQTLAQLKQAQTQLVQNEKMSSLGQLVAGVAHEINNPVNFIHGNLPHVEQYTQELLACIQLYQKHYPVPAAEIQAQAEALDLEFLQEDLAKILGSMKMGTDRICQIVLSLRTFSRMDEAEFKAVDIHDGIDSTLMILQHRLRATAERSEIKVIRDYTELPLVECFAGQLNQVFMNILVNAIDALEEANTQRSDCGIKPNINQITIRTSVVGLEWVEVAVIDNGLGMSEAVCQRIFDPFFTTKSIGKGTGMGLSISYQIITEKHHGKLKCFSTPGKGAEFVIQIPIQQAEIRIS